MHCIVRLDKYEIWFGDRRNVFVQTMSGNLESSWFYNYLNKWFRDWLEEQCISWDWDSHYGILLVDKQEDAVLIITMWS